MKRKNICNHADLLLRAMTNVWPHMHLYLSSSVKRAFQRLCGRPGIWQAVVKLFQAQVGDTCFMSDVWVPFRQRGLKWGSQPIFFSPHPPSLEHGMFARAQWFTAALYRRNCEHHNKWDNKVPNTCRWPWEVMIPFFMPRCAVDDEDYARFLFPNINKQYDKASKLIRRCCKCQL